MKRLFFLLALVLSCTFFAQAKTVNLVDYGAVPNDQQPDDAAMSAAIADVRQAGGGTVVFPGGKIILAGQHSLGQYGRYINFRLQGNKNSVVEVWTTWLLFDFSNTLQGEVEGLTFVGRPANPGDPRFTDVYVAVIYSPSTNQVTIRNTQFFGLRSNDSIVKAGNGDIVIENSQFEGNSAQVANVHAFGPYQRGLTIRNTVFLDYANWQDQYLSKSPYGIGAWVKVEGAATPTSATSHRQVRIEDCRFDEAAQTAVHLSNVFAAHISGINVNVAGPAGGNGITLNNVEFAAIKGSWFGWSSIARPAIVALNGSTVEATAVKTGGAVYLGDFDPSSRIETQYCNNCQARPIP